jgi:hypothetical protein
VSVSSPVVGYAIVGSTLTLNWPASYLGWLLQSNPAGLASPNWSTITGSDNATSFFITINPAKTNVFYRLVSP